jgi:hypothetical protein
MAGQILSLYGDRGRHFACQSLAAGSSLTRNAGRSHPHLFWSHTEERRSANILCSLRVSQRTLRRVSKHEQFDRAML